MDSARVVATVPSALRMAEMSLPGASRPRKRFSFFQATCGARPGRCSSMAFLTSLQYVSSAVRWSWANASAASSWAARRAASVPGGARLSALAVLR